MNLNRPITIKEFIEELKQYPDDWIFTIDLPTDFIHVLGTYGFDEGEVGLYIEQLTNQDG